MKLPPWIQLYATLVLAAHVVAWYGLRRLDVPYWLGLAGVTGVLVVLCEVLVRRLPKQTEDLFETLDRILQSEAEKRAREILRDPEKFAVVTCHDPASSDISTLGPRTAAFFGEFSSIRSFAGELELSRELIAPSTLKPGWLRIGTYIEHSEIAVIPGADPVYELDELSRDESPSPTYPSVYHLILAIDELYRD